MPNPIERVATKGAGAAKAVSARVKGLYGVFNTIAMQHAEASALLKRAQSADDADKQRDLWTSLRVELLSHEKAELAEVYPKLKEFAPLQDIVQRHDAEAMELEDGIADVDACEYGTQDWKDSLSALKALVLKHVQEEEEQFFPRAIEFVGKDDAAAIDERFKAAKKAVMADLGGS